MRWTVHGVLLVALVVGVFGLPPRLGGLTRDAAGLRHIRPAVLAVLGNRIVSYWLPLIPGAIACLRLRLVHKPPRAHR